MELSEDQQAAYDQIDEWYHNGETDRLRLAGYAGTGKSTLIRLLIRAIPLAKVCALTGKAAYVLRRKGIPASTIHKLIYTPEDLCRRCDLPARLPKPDTNEIVCSCEVKGKTRRGFIRQPFLDAKLVIVDEASMINRDLQRDIESYGKPVLYVGDHGQLEPIGDNPCLMRDPDLRLERIHRQAETSSIIRFAHHVRVGGSPKRFESDDHVKIYTEGKHPSDIHLFDAVLCSTNRTRVAANSRIRTLLGREGPPAVGERLICLRNSTEHRVFNGMQATLAHIDLRECVLVAVDDDGVEYGPMPYYPGQFGSEDISDDVAREVTLWDFGYALTVHKAQGSEWNRVVVLERLASTWSATRWRYTAATRAVEELAYCVPR